MQDQDHPSQLDTHNESYFASFTDMLVGIIFIFIILLMIVANNYQEATEAVIQTNQALRASRDRERDTERDKAHDKEVAQIKTQADSKVLEAARALEEVKALEAAKEFQEAKARDVTAAMKNTQDIPGIQAAPGIQAVQGAKSVSAARANEEAGLRADVRQNVFDDSRNKLLEKIQEAMNMQGFDVTADINQGTLLVPENILFDPNLDQGEVNYRGKQTLYMLANLFDKYLPCISPTADASRLDDCSSLGFTPNNGLDVIFIDDYPGVKASREDKLLLSVQRVVSVFNELKNDEPYLDKQLKNTAGTPILDIKVNQERRKASNQQLRNVPPATNFVVLRFIMRKPNQADMYRLRNSAGTGLTQ